MPSSIPLASIHFPYDNRILFIGCVFPISIIISLLPDDTCFWFKLGISFNILIGNSSFYMAAILL